MVKKNTIPILLFLLILGFASLSSCIKLSGNTHFEPMKVLTNNNNNNYNYAQNKPNSSDSALNWIQLPSTSSKFINPNALPGQGGAIAYSFRPIMM